MSVKPHPNPKRERASKLGLKSQAIACRRSATCSYPNLQLTFSVGMVAFMLFFANVSCGQSPPDEQLKNSIQPLIRNHKGEVGFAVRNLQTGEHYEHNADAPMPTASLIKLPVLVTTYRFAEAGKADLSKRIELKEEDKVPGSGELTEHFTAGTAFPLVDYARLMIRHSDNTATNVVASTIGLDATAKEMESLGLSETKLHSLVYRGSTSIFPERSKRFGLGSTTANEMVQLLAKLKAGDLVSAESTKAIFEHLFACADDTKIAREIGDVKYAHKTGEIANCRTDAGILFTETGPVAVCFLTTKNEDQTFADDNAAHLLAGDIGKAIVERFGTLKKDGTLQIGAFGKLVEALQRTLNDRMDPSPNLSIDGDYGPATRGAVERFQRETKLPETGKVTPDTWKALCTLIEQDDPVPAPHVVNSEKLSRSPQGSFSDPPFVTCKAWAIFDAETDELLFEHNSNAPLEAASTTKIMPAYLVCQLAAKDPSVLEETITFSVRADETPGSTSALRAGERVTVEELLYGLMLPSGNDASVAFAEHFGDRLYGDAESNVELSGYDKFITAMNSATKALGMKEAHYTNPHGLPDELHVISARDLGTLTLASLKSDLFRRVCSTRQFGCVASSKDGYKRNVLWKNSNRLLGTAGFSGVKTGTTSAAGACLVSLGERDGDELLMVTLGSSSTDARCADAQNLFRWAWQRRLSTEP